MADLYTVPLDTPISKLEASQAFKGLTNKERLYCHYLSRAAWEGGYICLLQTSPESVPLFLLLQELFNRQSVSSLRAVVKDSFTDEEFKVTKSRLGNTLINFCLSVHRAFWCTLVLCLLTWATIRASGTPNSSHLLAR